MNLNPFNKSARVTVSSVNVKWRGSTHSLGKIKVKGKTFEVTIPFQNKPQQDYTLSYLKTQKMPAITIRSIDVKTPFKLISVMPQLPVDVVESQKVEFKLQVEAPDYNYEGPMNTELISDSGDMAHIEVSKIIIAANGKQTELKERSAIMDIPKGQVFKQTLHLFGSIDFDQQVNKITIQPPFSFVSSDPKIPFKIDRTTGFLIDIYIQAPQQSYGGIMVIEVS